MLMRTTTRLQNKAGQIMAEGAEGETQTFINFLDEQTYYLAVKQGWIEPLEGCREDTTRVGS